MNTLRLGMASFRWLWISFCITVCCSPTIMGSDLSGPGDKERQLTLAVIERLKSEHLLRREIDDDMASRALDAFIECLDSNKSYFIKSDIEEFSAGRSQILSQLKQGDLSLVFDIYRRYQRRVQERAVTWRDLLATPTQYEFNTDDHMVIDSDALEYPRNNEEIRERWRLSIKYALLDEKVRGKTVFDAGAACKKILDRLERNLRLVSRTNGESVAETFLTCIAHRYDRLSRYFGPTPAKELQISITGGLQGIGAGLEDDGGIVVKSLVASGPAERDGRLKVGDRIIAVAQGDDGEFADLASQTLEESVSLVRGTAGSVVRLKILNRDGESKVYSLRRGRVVTADATAEGKVLEAGTKGDGGRFRVGYIELPSLYKDADAQGRSSTGDVRKLLEDFKERAVDVVLLDLRNNGGGPLNEAISLASLFVDGGPILQAKSNDGTVQKYDDTEAGMVWDKPLVLLVSRMTASGAEIVCGALQDYNRALIVGDESTNGTGTVQRIDDLGNGLGTLRVTEAQFYRLNGGSVQNYGVLSDIICPSPTGLTDNQDAKANGAIGFDRVAPISCTNSEMLNPALLRTLRENSFARRRASAEFARLTNRLERERSRRRQVLVSLNERTYRNRQKEVGTENIGESKPWERNFWWNEVFAVTTDYAGALGGKTPATVSPGNQPESRSIVVSKPVIPDHVAERRQIESEMIDLDRSIERLQDTIAGYRKQLQELDRIFDQARDAAHEADTTLKKAVVGFAGGFAIGKQIDVNNRMQRAQRSLDEKRDRMAELKKRLIELQN